ncbi:U6 small nuclear RNA (adenine-(43)-N(6))-methyltransferase [Fusarium oxysporum f. sp. albedinis]|nr:U6 small nuclear RNA (adenine-(43)-N(6))-methyltransferase [Fusarium oxysporum f. sp. albedinis]
MEGFLAYAVSEMRVFFDTRALAATIRCQASMTGGMIVRRRRQATTGWGIGSQSAKTQPRRSRGPAGVS